MYEKYIQIINNNVGIITSKNANKNGISRTILSKMVKNKLIKRITYGIYVTDEFIYDELFIFQMKHPNTVYSFNTALYLLNKKERTPEKFDITTTRNARNIANKNNITVNEVVQNYMFERILERLSISKYKYNFILKGGLLLSSIMGIDTRTTMDMDTCIKGINLTDQELYEVLTEILSINIDANVTFTIKNFKPIREEDTYGGLKYHLIATFDGIKVNLNIDIATGDIITPQEIEYKEIIHIIKEKLL